MSCSKFVRFTPIQNACAVPRSATTAGAKPVLPWMSVYRSADVHRVGACALGRRPRLPVVRGRAGEPGAVRVRIERRVVPARPEDAGARVDRRCRKELLRRSLVRRVDLRTGDVAEGRGRASSRRHRESGSRRRRRRRRRPRPSLRGRSGSGRCRRSPRSAAASSCTCPAQFDDGLARSGAAVCTGPKVFPRSAERAIQMPWRASMPATYTSPLGPTATVDKCGAPAAGATMTGDDHVFARSSLVLSTTADDFSLRLRVHAR